MREILFRGKRIFDGKWVYGFVYKQHSAAKLEEWYIREWETDFLVIPSTVGQYTGLKDKNGKKIFEGDILGGHFDEDFPENITIVEVIWKDYGFYTKEGSAGAGPLEEADGEIYEVIGNIHDNPGLLEGGEDNV